MSSQLSQVNQTKTLFNTLSKAPAVLKLLSEFFPHFNINNNIDKNELWNDDNIFKLAINLLYNYYYETDRKKILLVASFLIQKKFIYPFTLKLNNNKEHNSADIYTLYAYIKSRGKTKVPYIVKKSISNEIIKTEQCVICYDDFQQSNLNYVACFQCPCKCCSTCYNSIRVKKCPMCRCDNFKNIDTSEINHDVHFKYNKKQHSRKIDSNQFENFDNVLLIILNTSNKNNVVIEIINLMLNDYEANLSALYDNLKDNIQYYTNQFILYNLIDELSGGIFDEDIIEAIKQKSEEKSNNEPLFKLVGLNYHQKTITSKLIFMYSQINDSNEFYSSMGFEYNSNDFLFIDEESYDIISRDFNLKKYLKNNDDEITIEL